LDILLRLDLWDSKIALTRKHQEREKLKDQRMHDDVREGKNIFRMENMERSRTICSKYIAWIICALCDTLYLYCDSIIITNNLVDISKFMKSEYCN